MERLISPSEALNLFLKKGLPFLDVRSEGEFVEGHLPGTWNLPILNNEERHLVGLCYKEKGQEEAIRLGTDLTAPHKTSRIQKWREHFSRSQALLMCWRGGLRSKMASHWIQDFDHSLEVLRVEGGYKAIRHELLCEFENPPELLVLSGFTGANKTVLLNETLGPKIDLEGLAHHRGSSFGAIALPAQPSQATFENALAMAILQIDQRPILVEDESLNIGRVTLPRTFKDKMRVSPVIVLDATSRERAENIFVEYIERPVADGMAHDELQSALIKSLRALERRLGGLLTQQLEQKILDGFSKNSKDIHLEWIEALLVHYYDKRYSHAFDQYTRPLLHKGDYQSCQTYLKKTYC